MMTTVEETVIRLGFTFAGGIFLWAGDISINKWEALGFTLIGVAALATGLWPTLRRK